MRAAGFFILLFSAVIARADILLLSENHSPALLALTEGLSAALGKPVRQVHAEHQVKEDDLVVLAGDAAVRNWSGKQKNIAVWTKREAIEANESRIQSAVFSEPPLQRQLDLTRLLFPEARVALMVSEEAPVWVTSEINHLQGDDFTVFAKKPEDSLNRVLKETLAEHDVLLGTVDSGIYNPSTIKNILITAYRQNIPLIGPHQAYIRAGSIATTYSSLADTVKRLVEIIEAETLPKPGYNPYFSVTVNEQVARSLDIVLPADTAELTSLLR